MKQQVILDTGPLVAFLNAQDKYHAWAVSHWAQIEPPLLTCEAVLSEACFLLRHASKKTNPVLKLVEREVIRIAFNLSDNIASVAALMTKYSNIPASMADACLIRMAELNDHSPLLTLDTDFRIYRKHHRRVIPLLQPPI
jgi:predicted nucleic acid-binding protein